jgi:malonyl CoA-acyl carrier protein transacylase
MAVGGVARHVVDAALDRRPRELYLAVDNCPTQVVLAGHRDALQKAALELRNAGAVCSWLPFERAHHTPLFADWSQLLEKHYEELRGGPPNVTVYSCGTAQPYPTDREQICKLLASQWSAPVRFREAIEALYAAGARIFIETGPDNRLSTFVDDTLRGRSHRSVSASSSLRPDLLQLAHCAAELYALGIPVALGIFYGEAAVDLCAVRPAEQPPTRPATGHATIRDAILREHAAVARLVSESEARIAARLGALVTYAPTDSAFPLLGEVWRRDRGALRARQTFSAERHPVLLDHCLGRRGRGERGAPLPVLAFTVTAEIAAEAAACLSGMPVRALSQVRAHSWLAVEPGGLTVEIEADATERGIELRIIAVSNGKRTLSFEALCRCGARVLQPPVASVLTHRVPPRNWNRDAFYARYAFHGPGFQGIQSVEHVDADSVEARIGVTYLTALPSGSLQTDPAMLDCTGQLAALWALEQSGMRLGAYPYALEEVTIYSAPCAPGTSLQCRGRVERIRFETLSSDFEIAGPGALPIVRLHRLEQRLIRLPDRLWNLLFGSEPVPFALGAMLADPAVDWTMLANQSAIWARAVAHLVFTPQDLNTWYQQSRSDPAGRLRQMLQGYAPAQIAAPGIDAATSSDDRVGRHTWQR